MSSSLPTASNDYAAPADMQLDRASWDAALVSIGQRLRAAEAIRADFEALIALGTGQALQVISATVGPQLQAATASLAQLEADLAAVQDAISSLLAGNVPMSSVVGLNAALAAKAALTYVDAGLAAKAAAAHTQAIDTITGLQAALDAKAGVTHDHTIGAVIGLSAALSAKLPLTGGTLSGELDISLGNAATAGTYFTVKPTDWGAGKPYLFINKDAAEKSFTLGLWDTTGDPGTLHLSASAVTAPTPTAGENSTKVATTAFVANAFSGYAQFYTGSTQNLTDYPIGTVLLCHAGDQINYAGVNRNQSQQVYYSTPAASFAVYGVESGGTLLAGTWRQRGRAAFTDCLMQRVA